MNFKQAHSSNFKSGRTSIIKYIVIHYTANNGDTAKNNTDYFANNKNLSASAHYFVDENEIWQSVKEGDTAYHCGANTYKHKECRNYNSIGIELCSRKYADGTYYIKSETVANAIELTKELMAKYSVPVENVIRHYDVTGKNCPAPFVKDETLWQDFKNRLSKKIEVVDNKNTINNDVKIVTGNDIDYALKWKYGITFDSVENEKVFIKELDELRAKDSKAYWVFYKLVNGLTNINADVSTTTKKEVAPYTYHIEGITHVIECDPMNVKHIETQRATNKTNVGNFVNGTFFMMQANGKAYPLGVVVNEGQVISNYITHDKPVATLIIYTDGSVALKYVSDITKEANVKFAVSGYGVCPNITATEEGFTGSFSDVTRTTNRPIIGYRKSDNKIVIAVRSDSSASRANQTAKNLGLDFAISLDAGGSTTLKVNDVYKFSGDGRQIWGGITWS